MKSTFFSNKYLFVHFDFKESTRYTDNRKGSPYHYLAYMEEGHCKIVSDDATIEIKQGDVFYIPDGLSYQSYWYGKPDIKFHSYAFKFFPETASTRFSLQVINCDEELKQRIKGIPFNQKPQSYEVGIFYNCLSETVPYLKNDKKTRREQTFERACDLIHQHPNISVQNIAVMCNVSESGLYEVFKKVANKTPNQIKQEVLCEKAVQLLTSTNRSVQDISDSLGFSSTSYFRKVLYANLGKTPREIRKESVF